MAWGKTIFKNPPQGITMPGHDYAHGQKIAYLQAMGYDTLPEWEASPQWHYGTGLNGRRGGITPSAPTAHYLATGGQAGAPSKFNPLPKAKPAKRTTPPRPERRTYSYSLQIKAA